MQLLLDLSQIGHTIRLPNVIQPKESTAYITISGCVLDHIVITSALSNVEKLFYILVNALSIINLQNSKQRSIALSAESWATRLDCSKSQVFLLQKSLESKGYFIISKDKNRHNQNKRNLICPTLPDSVFKELCKHPDRVGQGHLNFSPIIESKLQYLDRTKLFIMLGYQVLKDISACEYLTPFHKLVWLDFYSRCYKTHMANSGSVADIGLTSLGFSFITSYQQLEDRYSCDKRLLSVALIELEEIGLIKREHFYVKKELGDQDRQDKSLWKISLLSPEQMSPDSGRGTKLGDADSAPSNYSASFNPSHNTSATIPNNSNSNTKGKAKDKIFTSTNILPSAVPTLTLEQKNEYYINDVIYELEVQNKGDGYSANVNEQDPHIKKLSGGDIITTAVDLGSNEPDLNAHSGVILPIDPEFRSFNIYNNINTKINIYKSNLDVVDNTSYSSPNKNNLNSFSNKTTEYNNRFRNGWQNNICGEVGGKNEHRGVSRRLKKSKGNIHEVSGFNVCTLLIKEKLKILSKDKADKARKFAYSLFSKELTKGYSSSITKHELAKQFIHHAATWKPTKISGYKDGKGDFEGTNYNKIANGLTDEQQIDIALSVAWNSVVKGTWQEPIEWKKAKALQYEYLEYKKKYQESGVVSKEIQSLEVVVNTLLSGAGDKKSGGDVGGAGDKKSGGDVGGAGDKKSGGDVGGAGNNKGKIADVDKAYGYDLAWKIKQEVDKELDRLEELDANKLQCLKMNDELPLSSSNKEVQVEKDVFIEENEKDRGGFIGELVVPNMKVRESEITVMKEHQYVNISQNNSINTSESNIEIKKYWDFPTEQHINTKQNMGINLSNNCQLEKTQSPIFEGLKELTIKNGDNGQQIYFKVLDIKPLNGVCYDNILDVASNNNKEYFAKLKLIEVDKFGDIVMILDSDNNPSYSFEKKGDSMSEVSLIPIGTSCDKQVALVNDCLSAGSSNNYNDDRILKDFIKIDNAIANIFKNLKQVTN